MGASVMEKESEVSVIDQVMDELISQELENKVEDSHSLVNVAPESVEDAKSSLVNIEDFIQYQPGGVEKSFSKKKIIPFSKSVKNPETQKEGERAGGGRASGLPPKESQEGSQQKGKIKNLINFFGSSTKQDLKKATVAMPYPNSGKRLESGDLHVNQQKQPYIYPSSPAGAGKNALSLHISVEQIENLRIAGKRINALETELERLRRDNEELIATGDVFKEQLDKIRLQNDDLKKMNEDRKQEHEDEKKILEDAFADLRHKMHKIEIKNQELNKRLLSNVQKIGVRERELENRLELMKRDNQTLLREKNQYILDLKNQLDVIKREGDVQKQKFENNLLKLESYKNQSSRAARGIKMALNILRGGELSVEDPSSGEKAG